MVGIGVLPVPGGPFGNPAMFCESCYARRVAEARDHRAACPTCKRPRALTAKDKAHGYQCDACADKAERGGE